MARQPCHEPARGLALLLADVVRCNIFEYVLKLGSSLEHAVRWNACCSAVHFGRLVATLRRSSTWLPGSSFFVAIFTYDLEYIMVDAPLLQRHLHARALQFIGVAPLRHPHLDLDDERYRVADVLHWLGPQRFHGVLRMGSAALMEVLCHRPFRPHCLADLGIFWSSDAWIPLAPQLLEAMTSSSM